MDLDLQPSPSSDISATLAGSTFVKSRQDIILEEAEVQETPTAGSLFNKGLSFWMIFLAICLSLFLFALDLTAVSTALPTVTSSLNGKDFVWASSAYSLASTSLIPASGGLSEIFGRRPTMLLSIALFALGSALCGSAHNMAWFISGRAIQGAGGGAIFSISAIIIGDLVPLEERGVFQGTTGLVWTVATAIGPVVGGALAQEDNWRWLFYLNLPISGVAFGLVLVFLTLRTPSGTFREKMSRMDWIGNAIITSSSAACALAFSWAGAKYSWSSVNVLAPLILGVVGIGIFLFYEHRYATHPIVPFSLLSNRTSLSGYLQMFFNASTVTPVIFFLPAYYQACTGVSTIRAGVLLLAFSGAIGPITILGGASVTIFKRYRPQLWIGWTFLITGLGLLSTLDANASLAKQVAFPPVLALGTGLIFAVVCFPVLAPTPIDQNAHALTLFAFVRSFATMWGISISTAVLQNELHGRLPQDFLTTLPGSVSTVYSLIPVIHTLPDDLKTSVRVAFADSVDRMWIVLAGIAGLGLISSLIMEGLPLHTQVDKKWGLEDKENQGIQEK